MNKLPVIRKDDRLTFTMKSIELAYDDSGADAGINVVWEMAVLSARKGQIPHLSGPHPLTDIVVRVFPRPLKEDGELDFDAVVVMAGRQIRESFQQIVDNLAD